MNISSTLNLQGILSIYKVFDDFRQELVYHNENLITLATKQFILSGIISAGVSSDPIAQLRVGTGGSVDVAGLFPKQENPTWTNLNVPLLDVVIAYDLDANVPSVTFLADLDQGTGNGSLITEAGLVTVAGNLFNVKTFPGISKTSEFSLHFSWTIKIA